MKNVIEKNSPGLSILKKFFSKEYFSYTELFASLVNTCKILLNSDFGFICHKQNDEINFFYTTENSFFKSNTSVSISVFNNFNIFLPQKETITAEIRVSSVDNSRKEINFQNKLSYISTPVFLLDKVFAHLLFFKSAGNFGDEDYIITENISKFLSSQIDKLSAFKKYEETKTKIFVLAERLNPDNFLFLYHYNKIENKYFLINNNIFEYLKKDISVDDINLNIDSLIEEIIHPDDLKIFDSRIQNLKSLKLNQINEVRYRLKDSTDNWRFFYHRDILYSCNENSEPVEYMGIIQEEKRAQSETQDNDIRRFIKHNFTNNKPKVMKENINEFFDLNIIQNLKDLGGDSDITFLKEVFDLYIEQAPGLINDIKKSYTDKNPVKLSQSAHALKGASLNIGAKKFADICKQLEMKGKENNLENVDELIKELDENFAITSEGLKTFV